MFGWFFKKKNIEQLKEETKKGFDAVKKDMSSIGEWIKHLNSKENKQDEEIKELKEVLSSVNDELENLKNVLSIITELKPKSNFKTPKQLFNKQTAVYPVQTAVQTAVQTPNLSNFSITERAIIWVLLNAEINMKLSYDDIASLLGKDRSTIRGQINTLKSKSEGLIEEIVERNGKKRVFIPEKMREKLLKKTKVRIKKEEN